MTAHILRAAGDALSPALHFLLLSLDALRLAGVLAWRRPGHSRWGPLSLHELVSDREFDVARLAVPEME